MFSMPPSSWPLNLLRSLRRSLQLLPPVNPQLRCSRCCHYTAASAPTTLLIPLLLLPPLQLLPLVSLLSQQFNTVHVASCHHSASLLPSVQPVAAALLLRFPAAFLQLLPELVPAAMAGWWQQLQWCQQRHRWQQLQWWQQQQWYQHGGRSCGVMAATTAPKLRIRVCTRTSNEYPDGAFRGYTACSNTAVSYIMKNDESGAGS